MDLLARSHWLGFTVPFARNTELDLIFVIARKCNLGFTGSFARTNLLGFNNVIARKSSLDFIISAARIAPSGLKRYLAIVPEERFNNICMPHQCPGIRL